MEDRSFFAEFLVIRKNNPKTINRSFDASEPFIATCPFF